MRASCLIGATLLLLASVTRAAAPVLPASGSMPAAVSVLPSAPALIEKTGPAVLRLTSRLKPIRNPLENDEAFRKFFPDVAKSAQDQAPHMGSATVIDAQSGWVLTTDYSVALGSGERAEKIELQTADGRLLEATVLTVSAEHGLALLKVPAERLVAVPLASEMPRPGTEVLALGYAGSLKAIIPTRGISGGTVDVDGLSGATVGPLLVSDAYYYPGFSGGPLINERGELIGIHTQVFARGGSGHGPGLAIGLADIRYVLDGYRRLGRLPRPRLGLQGEDRRVADGTVSGAIITVIEPGSPAASAGLLSGDVVLVAAGRPLADFTALARAVSNRYPGDTLELEVWRSGQTLKHTVTVGEFSADSSDAAP